MKILNAETEQSQIEITREELLVVNAALNEVCNGIEEFEFETRMGADRELVAAFLKEINSLLDKMDLLRM